MKLCNTGVLIFAYQLKYVLIHPKILLISSYLPLLEIGLKVEVVIKQEMDYYCQHNNRPLPFKVSRNMSV